MFTKHRIPEPLVSPLMMARVLGVLNTEGRPLTCGELRMHHKLANQKAMVLRLALSHLIATGRLVAITQHDARFNRAYTTYGLAPMKPERGVAS